MNTFPLEQSGFVTNSTTPVATSAEVGADTMPRIKSAADIPGITRDRMLSELSVQYDARCKCHESQAESKPIRFLLTLVRHEYLRAFGSGVASRIRPPCESGAAGDPNTRDAWSHRPPHPR